MIAQQELQHLLNLPDQEKLLLAHRLLGSLVKEPGEQSTEATPTPDIVPSEKKAENDDATELHPSAKWLLSMAGMSSGPGGISEHAGEEKIPFLSLVGIYSGGPSDTGERADEICRTEIKKRSGFTLKEELPD